MITFTEKDAHDIEKISDHMTSENMYQLKHQSDNQLIFFRSDLQTYWCTVKEMKDYLMEKIFGEVQDEWE